MSQATEDHTTIPLSELFTDPALGAVFRKAERDAGAAFAVPAPSPHLIPGGAVEPLPKPAGSRDLVRVVVASLFLASIFAGAMLPTLAVLR